MSERTPGPWEAAYLDQNGQRVVRGEDIEVCTCWHHCVGSIEKEMEANARLISAAPELLEALRAAVDCGMVPKSSASEGGAVGYASQVKVADQIRAAIAKAEGRE